MDLLITILVILSFVGIPVTLLAIGILCRVYGTKTSTIIFRLLLAFLAHCLSSAIFMVVLVFILIGPDPKPSDEVSWNRKLIRVFLMLVYGFIAWLLCSFVNGKLITSIDAVAPEPNKLKNDSICEMFLRVQ